MTDGTGNADFQFNAGAIGGYSPRGTGEASFAFTADGVGQIFEARASQEVVLSVAGAEGGDARASQMALLYMAGQPADEVFNSQDAILALTQITAKFEYNSAEALLTTGANDMPDTNASQIAVLTLSRTNPDRRKMRAFSFWMDGHHFYVLHLGNLTTLVYDTLTKKWSEWQTQLFNNWRANYGVNWNEDILAGGIDNSLIYAVAASAPTDDGLPIISVITGGFPMRMRTSATCDEVMITSSAGMAPGIVSVGMSLRTSDDYGISWQDWGELELATATPKTQVTWQSLGAITAPGRIFEITDRGAAKRINSLDLYSRDLQNG